METDTAERVRPLTRSSVIENGYSSRKDCASSMRVRKGKRKRMRQTTSSKKMARNIRAHDNRVSNRMLTTSEERRNEEESTSEITLEEVNKNKNADLENMVKHFMGKKKISFSHRLKRRSCAPVLISVIKSLPFGMALRKFKVRNCGVDLRFLREVLLYVRERKIRTKVLNLSGNKDIDLRLVDELREEMSSTVLDLSGTELDRKGIEKLGEMKQLKGLRLNYNAFTHESIVKTLVKLINNGLQDLSLIDSKITNQELAKISNQVKEQISLKVLDLSHVPLTKEGIEAVARMVNSAKGMERLALSDCTISEGLLKSFQEVIGEEILEFDISSNHQLAEGNVQVVTTLADKVGCRTLDLSSIWLDGAKIRQLMNTRKPSKVNKLFLSENLSVDVSAVGELVNKWKLTSLDVSECRLRPAQILDLAESIGDRKLRFIDVSDPMAVLTGERKEALKRLREKTHTLDASL